MATGVREREVAAGRVWRQSAIFVLVAAAGVAFGVGDQYLGWGARSAIGDAVSRMSVPWLVLPFLAGGTQVRGRGAALVGLVVTVAGLAGYYVMTLNPGLQVRVGHQPVLIFALTPAEMPVVLAGLVTGPLFGVLGQRWRTCRSLVSALAVAGVVLLEPAARAVGLEHGPVLAYLAELAVGVAAAVYFARGRRLGAARRQAV